MCKKVRNLLKTHQSWAQSYKEFLSVNLRYASF